MRTDYNFNEFDLGDIFKSVWGYSVPPLLFGIQNIVEKSLFGSPSNASDYSFERPSERREYNILTEPFYGLNNNGNEVFLPIWLEDSKGVKFMLQNTVSSIVSKKTIVETPLVSRQGTVKEEISIDDWEINVKGVIVSPDQDYPDQQVFDLRKIYESGQAYKIINARTSLLLDGNERVVFRNLKFPEIKGRKNVQAFECDLVSDIAFSLYEQ